MKNTIEINGFEFNDMEYLPPSDGHRIEIGYPEPVQAAKNASQDQKPDYSYLPEVFLTQVARAMMAGAKKYSKNNYLLGHNVCQLTAAIVRHAKRIEEGEWLDKDTSERLGQPVTHFACIAASCLMALHQHQFGTLKDDTYSKIKEIL